MYLKYMHLNTSVSSSIKLGFNNLAFQQTGSNAGVYKRVIRRMVRGERLRRGQTQRGAHARLSGWRKLDANCHPARRYKNGKRDRKILMRAHYSQPT